MNEWKTCRGIVDRGIEGIVRVVALGMGRVVYRVRVEGAENLPASGGCLIVCNHVSYTDTIPLSLAIPRKLRFTSEERLFDVPGLGRCLRAFGSIPVSAGSARTAIRRTADCIASGEAALLFPEGKLTLDGRLQPVKDGYSLIARKAGCPVLMVHLDGLWGSIFSFEGGRFFFKWPKVWRRTVRVTVSRPVSGEEATAEKLERFWTGCARRNATCVGVLGGDAFDSGVRSA